MNNSKLSYVNLFINLALVVLVVVLLIDKFNQGADNKSDISKGETKLKNETKIVMPAKSGNLSIVYINTDTMWSQYEFVKNALSKLEKKEKEMNAVYEKKTSKFQNEYQDYMTLSQNGVLTAASKKSREVSLEAQQRDIQLYEKKIQEELLQKKQIINNQINDTIAKFIKRYRAINGYTLVLQYSYLNSVLAADSALDVTADVVAKLNEEYRSHIK